MIKNVGKIDRMFRLFLGVFLVWFGLFILGGLQGKILGILVALISLMPFTMSATSSCFVFKWFKFHTLSQDEFKEYGDPYIKK